MTLSQGALPGILSTFRADETDATSTVNTIGSGTLYLDQIMIYNQRDTNNTVYVKFYDTGSSVTVGTTAPDFIFPCPGGEFVNYSFEPGGKFTNGMKVAVVLEPGTGGTTAPTQTVQYSLVYHT
tara:strand:+ start:24 stop:395 length:372 start_codon:yes stop_codon:yes gene_type:complete